ncbi:hypothetical protein BH24ACI2_BH24ACI2_00280 [soil metagenome]|nr:hypothetical protein [Acidobacteriota bacterium]
MDTLLQNQNNEKKGVNKVFLAAMLVAALLVAGGIYLWSFQPTIEEQKQQALEGAYLEGSPEFENYTKEIIISTDMNRTIESLTGLGTISMMIHGDVRNKGDKAVNGLQLKVSVVDKFEKPIKEKRIMVVPDQVEKLNKNETIHVAVPMDGFARDADRANVRWKVTAIRFQ